MNRIYLDHNATSPLDPAVREEMWPWLSGKTGNASSLHWFGQEARRALDQARARAAMLIGASPEEIIFTSGGTESNNLAILGSAAAPGKRTRKRMVISSIEHPAVWKPCLHVQENGGEVVLARTDRDGLLDVEAFFSAVRDQTVLVSVMLANHEVGTIQPVGALAERLRERGVLLHTDAVQAAGKIVIDVNELGADLLSFSGHKLHGPQGVGALYVRRGSQLSPLVFGGRQERGLRPGTENVAGLVGFGKACEIARERLSADAARVLALRDSFEEAILGLIPGVKIHGQGAPRLPNTTNIGFEGLDGQALVIHLDLMGLAASTGAACRSAEMEPSRVLLALGLTESQARSSVRFSFGRENQVQEAARAAELVVQAARRMREDRR